MTWSRPCRILIADRPHRFVFETISRTDCSRWTYDLEPSGAGTRVRQTSDLRRMSKLLAALISVLIPEHHDRTSALRADLIRLGQTATQIVGNPNA